MFFLQNYQEREKGDEFDSQIYLILLFNDLSLVLTVKRMNG
jgi:hypothetical protein